MPVPAFLPITTARLVLRSLQRADADTLFFYRAPPEVYQYQGFAAANEQQQAVFWQMLAEQPDLPDSWFQLAICLAENQTMIGDLGLHFLTDTAQVEIGITLAPAFQGRGYASEAMSAVFDYLFTHLHKHRITASIDPRNLKSIALVRKMGMRQEGHFIKSFKAGEEWFDDLYFALLEEEYHAFPKP